MSTEAFSETLQFITNVKLNELSKKNDKFVEHSAQVNNDADAHSNIDPVARLDVFLKGLKSWPSARSADFSLKDIERYLKQARHDPSFPTSIINEWTRQASQQYEHEALRFDFARLFGMLVNDWLKSKSSEYRNKITSHDGAEDTEDFEKLGRKETMEQKEKLESIIFEEKKIDITALETYLNDLFSTKEATEELKELRKRIKKFSKSLRERKITMDELKKVVQSVLRVDVLSEEKQATLKEFLRNPTIMDELASVLNMQLSTIKSWSWPTEGVVLEPRRHLNGRTRFFLDAEILTCLLLHYLGTLWSIEFKKALSTLLESRAWKQLPKKFSAADHTRRDVFFGKENESVEKLRREYDVDHFFMCQLPDDFETLRDHYGEDSKSDLSSGYVSITDREPRFETPVDLKQSLLHIIAADIVLNKTFHGQCTVVRTDLEWFGPSLPFDTIMTILTFFGVPEDDLKFMKSFLSCPIIFKDDASRQVRVRKRGIPISYMFSALFGELVMFTMDFAVNQRANGLFLHRIHDDFWFWDSERSRCATAWSEMQRYANIAGLTFNAEKTGSVVIGKDINYDDLPRGDVRWGFLVMDPASDGRFKVDQVMIDNHISEMRRQLSSTTSIFEWIQAYNKYMAFIVRNCGEPAIVYGKEHTDDIIDTLARVQKSLFANEGDGGHGTFSTAIAKMVKNRFGVSVDDVPQGWYRWPNAAGGLEVKDPLVELFLLHDGYKDRSVEEILKRATWSDESKFLDAKNRWESGNSSDRVSKYERISSSSVPGAHDVVQASDPFFAFEEFTKSREERGSWWCTAYRELLERPKQADIVCTPRLEASLKLLSDGLKAFGGQPERSLSGWGSLRPYWQCVIALHHDEMVKRFGSLAVVDPTTIPVGMVSVFKGSRVKWEQ